MVGGGGLLQLWALKHSSSFATTMSFFRFSRRLGPRDWKGSTKWRQNNTQSVAAASACSSFFYFFPRQRSFTLQQSRHNTHRQKKTAVGLARSLSLSHTHTLSGHVTSTNISQLHNRKITYELQHTRLTFYNAWVFVLSYDTKLVCWWTKRVLVNRSKTHQLMLGRIGACVCCSRLRPEGSS